jgi:hypothetical protein
LELGSQRQPAQESVRNTSRFGSQQQPNSSSQPEKAKLSDVYVREYSQPQPLEQPERTLQKVMTFNKELLLNARSIDTSLEKVSEALQQSSKLALSPIASSSSSSSAAPQSEFSSVTIKDVPVVVSQEKTYLAGTPPAPHFGQLQRQLNLMDYAESIRQGESINSSLSNTSKVIESYKPHQADYSSVREATE